MKVEIIAEIGVNHNGSLDLAKKLVDEAAAAGADVAKLQTFRSAQLASRFAPKADYQLATTDTAESQVDMLRALELDEAAHHELFEHCHSRGIRFLSAPFDLESADLLIDRLALDRIKIGSGELTNAPLLLSVARRGCPVILSTGMSSLGEIESALGVLAFGYLGETHRPSPAAFRDAFQSPHAQEILEAKVVLLHCTTEYPTPFEEVNLRVIPTLSRAFGLPVGLSDHTSGIAVAIAAVATGASMIEKHLTLDRSLPGPDHRASLEPAEFAALVKGIREVEKALGSNLKRPTRSELRNRSMARKSLVAADMIRKGDRFTEANLTIKRPGDGIAPVHYWDWLGKIADRDYERDEVIE